MSGFATITNSVSVIVLAAGMFFLGRAIGIGTRRANRQDHDLTELWAAHAALRTELTETTRARTQSELMIDQVIAGLREKEQRDAARGVRGVPDITPQQERTDP